MNDTARLVRSWRSRRGMSQAGAAEPAGTGQAAISRIESGRDLPTLALLERIAAALDCRLTVTFTATEKEAVRPRRPASQGLFLRSWGSAVIESV
ncbi:helix-turn-helix domain-containing protein [Streptomyces panaciradicis]|uniref:helix-turn-helix domain-containing protein n=1 Tax=Streptomyces panaciradicis TaxID=1470261 RepID=UPI00201CDC12|nr:helix-turn-helix transcriptional regulator [Streptomyces panaciradicis]